MINSSRSIRSDFDHVIERMKIDVDFLIKQVDQHLRAIGRAVDRSIGAGLPYIHIHYLELAVKDVWVNDGIDQPTLEPKILCCMLTIKIRVWRDGSHQIFQSEVHSCVASLANHGSVSREGAECGVPWIPRRGGLVMGGG
ncbi:hypothetical protein RJT34_06541 [Clitoria ternatea]|uniref:Uncharacterized protein n=1 Tax=Clitoria ternatea TaxID=43366 RepID=A0AAN9K3V4_CLITE